MRELRNIGFFSIAVLVVTFISIGLIFFISLEVYSLEGE